MPKWISNKVTSKFPENWGPGIPNKKKPGWRWLDPNPKNGGVRIDQANPHSPYPSQHVDHVIVRYEGKVIGRNGYPIKGAIDEDPINAHIPLAEYEKWTTWYRP